MITDEQFKIGLKVRETSCSNRIFEITKLTKTFVWLKRIPPLPSECDFKYRKSEIRDMEIY